jgi:hypothetical protein
MEDPTRELSSFILFGSGVLGTIQSRSDFRFSLLRPCDSLKCYCCRTVAQMRQGFPVFLVADVGQGQSSKIKIV